MKPEERHQRRGSSKSRLEQKSGDAIIFPTSKDGLYRCPCCGSKTLTERGSFEICPVCFWEDDGQDNQDADVVRGGPNGTLSLSQGRKNFQEYGASSERRRQFVRRATAEEVS